MSKIKWVCCLENNQQFIGFQSDIFEDSNSIYYDEYYETLIGVEICYRCKAAYATYMVVEFTIPKIYFHIPISIENYKRFYDMEVISKEDLFNARESDLVLVEREMSNNSIWQWEKVTSEMWKNI